MIWTGRLRMNFMCLEGQGKSSVILAKLPGDSNHWQIDQRPSPRSNALKLQIDSSGSQLPLYEEVFDRDRRISSDQWPV